MRVGNSYILCSRFDAASLLWAVSNATAWLPVLIARMWLSRVALPANRFDQLLLLPEIPSLDGWAPCQL